MCVRTRHKEGWDGCWSHDIISLSHRANLFLFLFWGNSGLTLVFTQNWSDWKKIVGCNLSGWKLLMLEQKMNRPEESSWQGCKPNRFFTWFFTDISPVQLRQHWTFSIFCVCLLSSALLYTPVTIESCVLNMTRALMQQKDTRPGYKRSTEEEKVTSSSRHLLFTSGTPGTIFTFERLKLKIIIILFGIIY